MPPKKSACIQCTAGDQRQALAEFLRLFLEMVDVPPDSAFSKLSPFGDPKPVAASHPGPAAKAPFDPDVMS